jgi:hypothetical protein
MGMEGLSVILQRREELMKAEERFDYVIVSEFNEWLSTGQGETQKELDDEIVRLKSEDSTRELTVFKAERLKKVTY